MTAAQLGLLPDTMSGLLETAINDARRLDPNSYRPRSSEWHTATEEGPCEICLAGSLIAGTFNSSPNTNMKPWMFSAETEVKLEALDAMRRGSWLQAFLSLYDRRPARAIQERLCFLPLPSCIDFNGWDEFNAHLDSLESIIPDLREIEADALEC